MFRALNRERLRFLFKRALDREQVKRFLDTRKTSLVMHGAQYQRRSRGSEADMSFLLNLPDKCLPTLSTWVTEELESDISLAPEALIAQFRAVENGGAQPSAADTKTFAQMGLKYLLRTNVPAAWLSFLKTAIATPESGAAREEPRDMPEAPVDSPSTGHAETIAVMDVLAKLKADDAEGAAAIVKGLPGSPLASELMDLVRLHRSRARAPEPGARIPRKLEAIPALPVERIPVLLRRTRQSAQDQPVFIDIEGVLIEGSLYTLTDSQALELFKHRQFVIGFPESRIPSFGEVAFWFVEEYPTDKPIKFRLKKPATPLHVVVSLEAGYKDYDEVRTAILNTRFEPWMKAVFKLKAGGYLHFPADTPGGARITFDQPMQFFRSLPCWEYLGMELFVGALPAADGEYDCADLSHTIGRILKESDARQQLPLTKAQIGTFIESLRASNSGLTTQRLDRLALEFDRYVEEGAHLRDISAHVLSSNAASDAIRIAKEEAVAAIRSENKNLRDEQSGLQRELLELRNRRDTLSAEMKQITSDVRTSVRKAFDRAKEAGSKSLGEVAVMAALLEHTVDSKKAAPSKSEAIGIETFERAPDARAVLAQVGMGALEAKVLAIAAPLICETGLPILVQGPRAGQVAQVLGCCVTPDRCSVWTVPIGLIDSGAMRAILDQSDPSGSLVIRNCNLSAFDSYATPLMDRLFQNVVDGKMRAVIFATTRGPAALPPDEDLLALAVIVDTAARFTSDPEFAALIEQLREDRSNTRIRSAALVKLFARLGNDPAHLELAKVLQAQGGLTGAS